MYKNLNKNLNEADKICLNRNLYVPCFKKLIRDSCRVGEYTVESQIYFSTEMDLDIPETVQVEEKNAEMNLILEKPFACFLVNKTLY